MKKLLCVFFLFTILNFYLQVSTHADLLDILFQPSKNLDPVERRGLWDLTKKLSRNNSVMLTSHLMEEVELVCNRVAFMINGVLTCIDRPSAMKDKIDSGLYLKIDLKSYLYIQLTLGSSMKSQEVQINSYFSRDCKS